jgi:hypothetical protein
MYSFGGKLKGICVFAVFFAFTYYFAIFHSMYSATFI